MTVIRPYDVYSPRIVSPLYYYAVAHTQSRLIARFACSGAAESSATICCEQHVEGVGRHGHIMGEDTVNQHSGGERANFPTARRSARLHERRDRRGGGRQLRARHVEWTTETGRSGGR